MTAWLRWPGDKEEKESRMVLDVAMLAPFFFTEGAKGLQSCDGDWVVAAWAEMAFGGTLGNKEEQMCKQAVALMQRHLAYFKGTRARVNSAWVRPLLALEVVAAAKGMWAVQLVGYAFQEEEKGQPVVARCEIATWGSRGGTAEPALLARMLRALYVHVRDFPMLQGLQVRGDARDTLLLPAPAPPGARQDVFKAYQAEESAKRKWWMQAALMPDCTVAARGNGIVLLRSLPNGTRHGGASREAHAPRAASPTGLAQQGRCRSTREEAGQGAPVAPARAEGRGLPR